MSNQTTRSPLSTAPLLSSLTDSAFGRASLVFDLKTKGAQALMLFDERL